MKLNALTSALLVSTLGFSAAASATVIDLFSEPANQTVKVDLDAGGSFGDSAFNEYDALDDATILGGSRDLIVTLLGQNPGTGGAATKASVKNGVYSFSNDAGIIGQAAIQWDGNDDSATLDKEGLFKYYGPEGANLVDQPGCPASGCNTLVATVVQADAGFEYSIGIYSSEEDYTILTANTLFKIGYDLADCGLDPTCIVGPYESIYEFDWFSLATGDYFLGGLPFSIYKSRYGADMEHVGAIEFIANSNGQTANVDLTLDSVTKKNLPEPGTLALLGIGLLGASLAARRK